MLRKCYMHHGFENIHYRVVSIMIIKLSSTIIPYWHLDAFSHISKFFLMPVLKMRQIRRKILVEWVLPNRNVIYIVSLIVTFKIPNTLHASRFQQTFSNELWACRLQNFDPPCNAYLHLETLTLNLQLLPNASFENQAVFSGKIFWSEFYPRDV